MGRRGVLLAVLPIVGLLTLGCGSVQPATTSASTAVPMAFGFNSQLFFESSGSTAREAEMATRAGARIQRAAVSWKGMQPNASDPVLPDEGGAPVGALRDRDGYLAQLDRGYQTMTANHVRPLFIVFDAPLWATRYDDCSRPLRYCRRPPRDAKLVADHDHLPAWSLFAAAIAKRYPRAVIETGNEPNLHWGDSDSAPTPEDAAAAACAAHDAVKAVGSTRVVLSPGLADQRLGEYLDRMLRAGAARCWDLYSVHLYFGEETHFERRLDDKLRDLRALRAGYGDRDRMWVTEAGWTTSGWFRVSESQQADALRRLRRQLEGEPDVDALLVHTLRDAPNNLYRAINDPEYGYGVLHSDWSPKKAYGALRDG